MYKKVFKRIIDIIASFILLFIFFPIIFAIIAFLYFLNKKHIFFCQERPGLNLIHFKIIKFATMNNLKDDNGKLLPDSDRITNVGRFLRKSSLDELPQLINVFIGDMSLVGPRPLSITYKHRYSEEQMRRHDVKPGITGWAQVNGRNSITWTQKFKYDIWYVDNISFLLDVRILFKTFLKVVARKDVLEGGTSEAESFNGTN